MFVLLRVFWKRTTFIFVRSNESTSKPGPREERSDSETAVRFLIARDQVNREFGDVAPQIFTIMRNCE